MRKFLNALFGKRMIPEPPDSLVIVTYQDGHQEKVRGVTANPGRCTAERCTCIGPPRSTLRMFCESWDASHVVGQIELESITNWFSLPDQLRERAYQHLEKIIRRDAPETLQKWVKQLAAGQALGSDDIRFHFAAGMAIRNLLREVVKDDELPWSKSVDAKGHVCVDVGNWGDFYYGAIHELAERYSHAGVA